jgi:hypothetical protein
MRKNPTQPDLSIALDGFKYELVFDFEAVATAEDLLGIPLLTGLTQKQATAPTISLVRAMLHACVLVKQPLMTYEETKALVNRHNITDIWVKVLECWVASMREPDPEEDAVAADPS